MSGTGKSVVYPITPSGESIIDSILIGSMWDETTLTFSMPTSNSEYSSSYGGGEDATLDGITAAMSDVVFYALDTDGSASDGFSVEGFTNLTLTYTTSTSATIRVAQTSTDPYGAYTAWSYYPWTSESGGDVWFLDTYYNYTNPVAGDYAYLTILHELGHSLGLSHGHTADGFGTLPYDYDSMEYTVMTYRSYVGADYTYGYVNETYGFAQSFMMLDIAALQYLYGADYTTNSGNTVYKWTPGSGVTMVDGSAAITPGANRIFATIWDGGGNDTYDLSAYTTGVSVDLAPGAYSVFSTTQLADLGDGNDASGNIYNALLFEDDTRSLIENAIGGSGDDLLSGNQGKNTLEGNDGDDELRGHGGKDKLLGGDGDDKLRGGNANDTLRGGKDRDSIYGDKGGDVIYGDDGNDKLFGGAGNDTLIGGAGKDTITGGAGRDTMTGKGGADTFVFNDASESKANLSKTDTITDFKSGTDKLDLSGLTGGTFTLNLGGSFTGTGPSIISVQKGSDLFIRADVDGDGVADFGVLLEGISSVTAADFLL